MSEDTPTKVPFSAQAVWDGYWEFYHDDDCDAVLDPDTKVCSACGWRPDLQSMGARRTGKDVGANQSSTPLPSSEGTVKSPKCHKCKGSGDADNAQFSCSECHGSGICGHTLVRLKMRPPKD